VQQVQDLRCRQRPVLLSGLPVNRQPAVLLLGLCLRWRGLCFRNGFVQLIRIPEPVIDVWFFVFMVFFLFCCSVFPSPFTEKPSRQPSPRRYPSGGAVSGGAGLCGEA